MNHAINSALTHYDHKMWCTIEGKLGMKAVFSAVENGDEAALLDLLKSGADPNQVDEFGDSLLVAALRNQTHWVIDLLLSHGADPDFSIEDEPSARQLAPLFSYEFGSAKSAA